MWTKHESSPPHFNAENPYQTFKWYLKILTSKFYNAESGTHRVSNRAETAVSNKVIERVFKSICVLTLR